MRSDDLRCIFPFKYTHVTLFQRNTDVIRFFHLGDQFVESLGLGPKMGSITFVKALAEGDEIWNFDGFLEK